MTGTDWQLWFKKWFKIMVLKNCLKLWFKNGLKLWFKNCLKLWFKNSLKLWFKIMV